MQCFSCKNVLDVLNGKQNVKLESGFISFKNYSKQTPAPFKIYADIAYILKNVDSSINNNGISYTKKYQDHVACSFAYKIVCVDIDLAKRLFCTVEKMQLINLPDQFLTSITIVEE